MSYLTAGVLAVAGILVGLGVWQLLRRPDYRDAREAAERGW